MKRSDAIKKIRQILLRRRDALRRSVSGQLDLPSRDEVKAVGDEIDAAVESLHDELSSQLAAAESRELQRIDIALERIKEGTYGVCEHCGKNIPLARLQAVPYATLCINCQREMELQGLSSDSSAFGDPPGFNEATMDLLDDVIS